MYWTMWGDDCQLLRANLDGTQRKVLISGLGRVQDLTIDYVDRRIYWTDIDQKNIQSATLLGGSLNRNTILAWLTGKHSRHHNRFRAWQGRRAERVVTCFFFFFCIPDHARPSVRWVGRSPQSAAVSQLVPKASFGHPSDNAMSDISKSRRWGRTAGCG